MNIGKKDLTILSHTFVCSSHIQRISTLFKLILDGRSPVQAKGFYISSPGRHAKL